jgi:hypothetical protein
MSSPVNPHPPTATMGNSLADVGSKPYKCAHIGQFVQISKACVGSNLFITLIKDDDLRARTIVQFISTRFLAPFVFASSALSNQRI